MVEQVKAYQTVDAVELFKETYDSTPASPVESRDQFLAHVKRNLPCKLRLKRNKPEHQEATPWYNMWIEDVEDNKTEVRKTLNF